VKILRNTNDKGIISFYFLFVLLPLINEATQYNLCNFSIISYGLNILIFAFKIGIAQYSVKIHTNGRCIFI
jgi:hypothetical protein